MIGLAVLYGLATVFLWVATPGFTDFFRPWGFQATLAALVGIASYLVGLAWMIRIYRAQREPEQRTWRYRDY